MEYAITEPTFYRGDVVYIPSYLDYVFLLTNVNLSDVTKTLLKNAASKHQGQAGWYQRVDDGWNVHSSYADFSVYPRNYYNIMNFLHHVYEL